MPSLQEVTDAVVRRAQRQGHVVPREIRAELKLAELPETQWKDVVALAKGSLHYRQGRYYPVAAVSPRLHAQQESQRRIERAVRQMIKARKEADRRSERRGERRIDFVQCVKVRTDQGKEYMLLSRDISATGIRLIGTQRLLGHKLRVDVLASDDAPARAFLVRILWTCAVGDDLFENGGAFIDLIEP